MKKNFLIVFLLSLGAIVSCSKVTDYGKPLIDPTTIQNDFNTWWTYHKKNVRLTTDFMAIDHTSELIDKEDFLKKLTSGDYIPLALDSKDSLTYYRLYKLEKAADENIRRTIRSTSATIYRNFKMEGEQFPNFNFTALDGHIFNKSNTKDKIIILKCWFIGCKPCVAEMPELNELVKGYQDRNDVVFISLARDSGEDLEKFFSKRAFNYHNIPDQEQFIVEDLKVRTFPTHFIIDKEGVIKKVVTSYDELIFALEQEAQI